MRVNSLAVTLRADSNISNDERTLDSAQHHGLLDEKEALIEVEETLKRLNRLGVTIRQSTRSSVHHRTKQFAQKLDLRPVDDLCSSLVQTLYPKAHLSLRNLLSMSMSYWVANILFHKSH